MTRRLTITLRPGEQRVITIPAEWAGQRVLVTRARKKIGTKSKGEQDVVLIGQPTRDQE